MENLMEELIHFVSEFTAEEVENRQQMEQKLLAYNKSRLKKKKFEGSWANYKKKLVTIGFVNTLVAKKNTKRILKAIPQERVKKTSYDIIQDIQNNSDKYLRAYELIEDDMKQMYVDLLMLRVTGDISYALKYSREETEQYITDRIDFRDIHNILDCGAFDGDSMKRFVDYGVPIRQYQAYELDAVNFAHLKKKGEDIATKSGIELFLKKNGVGEKNEILNYEADGNSSRIVDYITSDRIEIVSIDNDVEIVPDYIKMDIEGAEVPALLGGQNIIRKYKPKLAICIYHLKDDFWKIPLLIHEICPDYKHYWLGHYSMGYLETVLYVAE